MKTLLTPLGGHAAGMLRYLGLGYRRFGITPLKSPPRANWEFFAVVSGLCAPVLPGESGSELKANTLWVFPPGSAHGWSGNQRHRAYITAFHFGVVPVQLETAVRERGHLVLPLEAGERKRLVALAKEIRPEFQQPDRLSNLKFQGVLVELTLHALRKLPLLKVPLPPSPARRTADAAMARYSADLGANLSVADVARAVHVSVSTLRRVFHDTLGEGPIRVFARLRLEAVMRLMAESTLKLEEVAEICGYSCASDLCRSFKTAMGITPAQWRRTRLSGPGYIRK